MDDATVEALGKLSEAFEVVEDARGALFHFHRLIGRADLALGQAVDMLRDAGHGDLADRIQHDVVGRNVITDRWTFQIVEDFDDGYWTAFRDYDVRARDQLADGDRHVLEARMKQRERTAGHPQHQAGPALEE